MSLGSPSEVPWLQSLLSTSSITLDTLMSITDSDNLEWGTSFSPNTSSLKSSQDTELSTTLICSTSYRLASRSHTPISGNKCGMREECKDSESVRQKTANVAHLFEFFNGNPRTMDFKTTLVCPSESILGFDIHVRILSLISIKNHSLFGRVIDWFIGIWPIGPGNWLKPPGGGGGNWPGTT